MMFVFMVKVLLHIKISYKYVPVDKYYKYSLNGANVSPFNCVVGAIVKRISNIKYIHVQVR